MENLEQDINEILTSRKRLRALDRANILDTPTEAIYDGLTEKILTDLSVPISMVSIVDMNRQFLKSQQGMPDPFATNREMPISHAFCQHTIHHGKTYAINDMRDAQVFFDHPAVMNFNVRAYLGEPVVFDGEIIGTVCVIDFKPRQWDQKDIDHLKACAKFVQDDLRERNPS